MEYLTLNSAEDKYFSRDYYKRMQLAVLMITNSGDTKLGSLSRRWADLGGSNGKTGHELGKLVLGYRLGLPTLIFDVMLL